MYRNAYYQYVYHVTSHIHNIDRYSSTVELSFDESLINGARVCTNSILCGNIYNNLAHEYDTCQQLN